MNIYEELNTLYGMSNKGKEDFWPSYIVPYTPVTEIKKNGNMTTIKKNYYFGLQSVTKLVPLQTELVYDLVKIHIERWLKDHVDELVWCWREEGYISLAHGNDCFGETLVEIVEYAVNVNNGDENDF